MWLSAERTDKQQSWSQYINLAAAALRSERHSVEQKFALGLKERTCWIAGCVSAAW